MGRTLPLLAVLLVGTSVEAQEHVQIDFDGWPEVACLTPDRACEGAYVTTEMPIVATDALPISCGTGGCFQLRWPSDASFRHIKTPWNPGPDALTAFAQVKMKFGEDYYAADDDFVGVEYQPLIRFFATNLHELGIDVAMIHRAGEEPRVVIISAPDATLIGGVPYSGDHTTTCHVDVDVDVDAPSLGGFFTIQATIQLDPTGTGNDRCKLRINDDPTLTSTKEGLDFRGGHADGFRFRYAAFFGRVSNDSRDAPCNAAPWPPCGDTMPTRTIIADDLCVSTDPLADEEGRCEPGATVPEDGGVPPIGTPDSGLPPATADAADATSFRGSGGCTCDTGGLGGTGDVPASLFAVVFALLIGRRRWRR